MKQPGQNQNSANTLARQSNQNTGYAVLRFNVINSIKSCFGIGFSVLLMMQLCCANAMSQPLTSSIEKAFNALEVYDYFEARKLFSKSLKKKPVLASYGLADILQRGDNPFLNLDSAYNLANFSLLNVPAAKTSERKLMLVYKVDSNSINNLITTITNKAFLQAKKSYNINQLNNFIGHYYSSHLVVPAILIRDSLAFDLTLDAGTSKDFRQYMDEYPNSKLRGQAMDRMHLAQYQESVTDGDTDSYKNFIATFPLNPYLNDAYANIYKLSVTDENDVAQLEKFIAENPKNPYIREAWLKIYELFFAVHFGHDAILSFKKKYPDYPNQEKLDFEYLLATTDFLPVLVKNKWGFINPLGEEMIEAKYESVELFSEGLAIIEQNEKVGYVAKNGLEIVTPLYDDAEDFHNGLAVVFKDDKCGVINRTGKLVIPIIYDEISDFDNGLAAASKGAGYGYISSEGIPVIKFVFDEAGSFVEGFAICEKNGLLGIIDTLGNTVVDFKYESLENFYQGVARFGLDKNVGLISDNGVVIADAVYDEIGVFSFNRAIAIKSRKVGYLGVDGSLVIPLKYQSGINSLLKGTFIDGVAVVKLNGRYGVIDTAGRSVLKPYFEDVGLVSDTLIPVKKRGKWGVYNYASRKNLTGYIYDAVKAIHTDRFIAKYKGGWTVTDFNGDRIIPAEYDFIEKISNDYYLVESGNNKGLANSNGKIIIMDAFQNIDIVMDKYVMLTKSNSLRWYDLESNDFIEVEE
jgi:WG repeat protein